MGKNALCAKRFFVLGSMILLLAACNPTTPQVNSAPPNTPAIEAIESPTTVPTATVYNSAPQNETLDANCRITINFFLGYKRGDDLRAFRNLFAPSSRYLADSYRPPIEALVLLELMPASQYWQENYPGTPMPGVILPEGPDEYFYYVRFTGHYDPEATPASWYPDSMVMIMLADSPYSCKIKGFGKG